MKEIVKSYFDKRSLVNHQLASYNDCIPLSDGKPSRMEKIVRNIRIGSDDFEVDETEGGLIKLDVLEKEIVVRVKNIRLGQPTIREANGAEHPATPMECRLRKLTYFAPVYLDFRIYRDDLPPSPGADLGYMDEKNVHIGNLPIMVRSARCNLHANNIDSNRKLSPDTSPEDAEQYVKLLRKFGEDPVDPGGYFIINGTERVLISMEDLAPNRVTVERNKKYAHDTEVAKIFSQKDGVRKPLNVEKRRDGMLMVKIPSAGTTAIPVVLLMRALGMSNDREIFSSIAGPVEAMKYTVANLNDVKDNEEYGVENEEEALAWLEKKFAAGQQKEYRESRIQNLLDKELLPHLGAAYEHRQKKAIFLGRIVRQVLEMAINNKDPNDKDHYANKRVRLAGDLIEDLFRVSLQQLARDLKYQLERHHNRKRELKINSCLRPDVLTSKIMHALATGNWVGGRSGVSQLLDRTTFLSALSHMRRVTSPLVRSQPHFEARDLHPTQWGRLCPNETPEGQNCGLVKNAAQMIDVSEEVAEGDVKELLKETGVNDNPDGWADGSRVHVNGDIFGLHKRPQKLVSQFKRRRRQGKIRHEVSIRHDTENKDVFINTDRGRILRPLLVIENGSLTLSKAHLDALRSNELDFNDLVRSGVVEWVDAEEEEDLLIASRPYDLPSHSPKNKRPINPDKVEWLNLGEHDISHAKLAAEIHLPNGKTVVEKFKVPLNYYQDDMDALKRKEKKGNTVLIFTHVEIDPQLILGVCASLIPYPEHNSTPRVTGGTAMVKQSLGLSSANYRLRPDTRAHIMHYPQKSIVGTRAMDSTKFNQRPGGQNLVVAIMSHHGYNMQDAIVMNKASVERSMGRSSFMRTYNAENKRFPGGQEERIEIPGTGLDEIKGLKSWDSYSHLERDGLPIPETFLSTAKGENPVLVGKTSPPRFLEEAHGAFLQAQERRESSMNVRHGEYGWVDNVFVTESLDSGRLVRITLRSNKIPELGDKFASRHGQKGIIGRLVDQEDMPFTEDGVIPDILINPHAIPSRMTVAHVLEMIGGKVGSMETRRIDGTAFTGEKEESLRSGLLRNGFNHTGRESMVNGETGESYPAEVFVGVIYYQRLHHLVSSKLHARSRGRVQILTRQPTEGRARQGGLRFGEMERDCLISHGASMVIKDRLLGESDGIDLFVCAQSGHIAWYDPRKRTYVSPIHGDGAEVYKIQTSYAFKLLLDEMKSLGVAMRLELEDQR
ncbi:MAG: DNA-directed RNA polymerase subunit B [Euryarchaeota archaeon]|jgi:DNA-directed RNA polymerase subunit B|nr:DNA-directed RNA polymerase subunit B [Euryarchaeota archaeon]MBT4802714.1 DNA-directed RNA polymerase subunit B [Euryarchaeota archaeon]MBT6683618.1 DNA-directed RNA polymerase subunit B [Euryarchaeota archaeon]MBT6874514.1 DNA-directed RNA polymerase subunit B [Euryarchaeota archaeon]MBT7413422.1 DNA-directed RNA polymerase subunit B [Euryarchaeota archaeon]